MVARKPGYCSRAALQSFVASSMNSGQVLQVGGRGTRLAFTPCCSLRKGKEDVLDELLVLLNSDGLDLLNERLLRGLSSGLSLLLLVLEEGLLGELLERELEMERLLCELGSVLDRVSEVDVVDLKKGQDKSTPDSKRASVKGL